MDAGNACLCRDLCVRDHVLPLDVEELAQTFHVQVVELSGMSAVHSPRLAGIDQCSEHCSQVDLHLAGLADSSSLPHFLPESAIFRAGFGQSVTSTSILAPPWRECHSCR